jgi:hypothetical protein
VACRGVGSEKGEVAAVGGGPARFEMSRSGSCSEKKPASGGKTAAKRRNAGPAFGCRESHARTTASARAQSKQIALQKVAMQSRCRCDREGVCRAARTRCAVLSATQWGSRQRVD